MPSAQYAEKRYLGNLLTLVVCGELAPAMAETAITSLVASRLGFFFLNYFAFPV